MKTWTQSKTIILNVIMALGGIIPLIDQDLLTLIGVTDVVKYLAILGTINTILNVILRFLTNKGIGTASAVNAFADDIGAPIPPKRPNNGQ